MAKSNVVKVPDISHPTLCYREASTMERCDRPKGHKGPHTWTLGIVLRLAKVYTVDTDQAALIALVAEARAAAAAVGVTHGQ